MDKTGIPSGVAVGGDKSEEKLVDLLSKNRIEQMMQKKFVLSRDKFDLQLSYKSEEIKLIMEEIKMLDSDEVEEKKGLKKRWKELKEEKQKIYDSYMTFTETEESKRHGVQIQWTNNEDQDAHGTFLPY